MSEIPERLDVGQEIETEIVAVTGDTIFINLNQKSEGVIDKAELADADGNVSVKEGDTIKAYFMGFINGEMKFTTKVSGPKASKALIESAWKSGIPVEGSVEKEIKGGYEIKIGEARAFCPFSLMGGRKKDEAESFVGRHLTFKITEYKNDGKDIIVSNRAILEEERSARISSAAKSITIGATVQGKVTALHNYGAFVDINGFQALLPISEISFERVNDISKVLKVGQEIKASVIRADWDKEKVSLSMKALLSDPWDTADERYSEGTKIDGKISRIADFGLFVNLEPGIDGLVHVSELGVEKNTNLKKVYKVGDAMSVIVKSVDVENRRIALQTSSSREQDENTSEYLSGHSSDDSGETYNPFAAFFKK